MFHHSKYNSRSYNMYFLVLEFFSVISNAPNSRTTFPHQKSLFLTLNVQAMGKMGGSFLELVTSRAGRYKACAFFGTKLTIIEPLTTENECLEFLWPSVWRLQGEKHEELVIFSVFPPKKQTSEKSEHTKGCYISIRMLLEMHVVCFEACR